VKRAEGRVQEVPAFDDALAGIVADQQAVDLRQELVAITGASPDHPGLLGLGRRPPDTVFAQRMGARPAWRRAFVPAGRTRFQVRGRPQRGEHGCRRGWIVAGPADIADAEIVGLEFLLAGEAQQVPLAELARGLRDLARPGQHPGETGDDLRQKPGAAALAAVARVDVADLMAEHEREFGFVVHQSEQLARDVDIAAGDGEGVHHGRVERGEAECAAAARNIGIAGHLAANRLDICAARAAFFSAELGKDLRVLLSRLLRRALRQLARGALGETLARQRQRGKRGGKHEQLLLGISDTPCCGGTRVHVPPKPEMLAAGSFHRPEPGGQPIDRNLARRSARSSAGRLAESICNS
jgi:hypothetical protein